MIQFYDLPVELQIETFLCLLEMQAEHKKLKTLFQLRTVSKEFKSTIDNCLQFWKPYLSKQTLASAKENSTPYPQCLYQQATRLGNFIGNNPKSVVFLTQLAIQDPKEANVIVNHKTCRKFFLREENLQYIIRVAITSELIAFFILQDLQFRKAILGHNNKETFIKELAKAHALIQSFIDQKDEELKALVSSSQ